jgi:serine/threonine protein phosphatase PrpC
MTGGTARVNGILAISRSVGVKALRPAVRSTPEIFPLRIAGPSRLIVATDGVFDVLTNQRVAELGDPELIVQTALANGARDNLAVATVEFSNSVPEIAREEL